MKYRNYIIATLFVEGFVALSFQMLFMRKLLKYVGSSVNYIGIIIGVILLLMAFGYRNGGMQKKFDLKYAKDGDSKSYLNAVSNKIGLNFIIVALIGSLALNDTIIDLIMIFDGAFISLSIYSLLFIAPIIFLMASTVPYIVRFFSDVKREEAASKALYFSTIGSFFGSVITANFLFRYYGIYETTILVIGLIFVFGVYSLSLNRGRFNMKDLSNIFISGSLACLFLFIGVDSTVIKSNEYYTYSVVKNDHFKAFQVDRSYSSLIMNDGGNSPYIESLRELIFKRAGLENQDVLIIGAGGFVAGRGMENSGHKFTYIDVDPMMIDIAENNFLDGKINGNFIAKDGRAYLLGNDKQYDVIILDAYSNAKSIPENLSTIEFFNEVKKDIKVGGWFVANVIADVNFNDQYSKNIYKTINEAFNFCFANLLDYDQDYSNIIYMCRNLDSDGDVYIDNKNLSNIEFNDMKIFRWCLWILHIGT